MTKKGLAPEQLAIEFLMLANHAEAINGLLYISGGGWTDHFRARGPDGTPSPSYLGIGVSILVPWNETNQVLRLAIRVENEDATTVIAQIQGQLSVGRPPTLPQGAEQHAVAAIPLALVFPTPGKYRLVATLNEDIDQRQWSFRVYDVAGPIQVPPPA